MKKLVMAAVAGCLALASTAFAASTTIEFKRDTGESRVVTLSDGVLTLADGTTGSYTWDEGTGKMCFTVGEETGCVTFEASDSAPGVGDSRRYTTDDGAEGTATVTAMTE